MLDDFLKPQSWSLPYVRFEYLGGSYEGTGRLFWDASSGFRVEVNDARRDTSLPSTVTFFAERVLTDRDYTSIRMRCSAYDWIVAPRVRLADRPELLHDGSLTVHTDRAVFMSRYNSELPKPYREVSAIYVVPRRGAALPDRLTTTVSINHEVVQRTVGLGALSWESMGDRVVARLIDDEALHLSITGTALPRSQVVAWPRAFGEAWSLLSGSTLSMIRTTRASRTHEVTEVRRSRAPVHLGPLSPLPGIYVIDKEVLMRLTDFLAGRTRQALVALRLLERLVSAAGQKHLDAAELLTATALEAAIRTLYSWPVDGPEPTKGLVSRGLERFGQEYQAVDWDITSKAVLAAQGRLRTRNAHPDWIPDQDLDRQQKLEQTWADIKVLATFYGRMICLMAGIPPVGDQAAMHDGVGLPAPNRA